MLFPLCCIAQDVSVKGRITDGNGTALPGTTVALKNSTKGTTADKDGNYTIVAGPGATLVFSAIAALSAARLAERPVSVA